MIIQTTDRISYSLTAREYTDEGFLRVPARVARTGIQEYLASELGLTGDSNRIVKVMRPAEEVFSQESLDTFKGADITIEHPEKMVDSDNYKKVSIGTTLDAGSQDGDFVKCDLIIKDKQGIKSAEQGKVQVSVGYTAIYDDKVPENADYEFIQREIRVNHIALVDRARAGAQARLFDHKPRIANMALITLDAGKTVEVEDNSSAQLVNDHIERQNKRVVDAEAETEKTKAEKDAMEEEKKEAEDNLLEEKKKSSDEAISMRVENLLKVKDEAMKVAGKEFVTDSIDEITIKREALVSLHPTKDWADKTDAYIVASFDIESEKEAEDEDDKDDKKKATDAYKQLAIDAAAKSTEKGSPRSKTIDSMTQSWKQTVGDK